MAAKIFFFEYENDVRRRMTFEKYRSFLWQIQIWHLKSSWPWISLGLAWKFVIDRKICPKIAFEENNNLMWVQKVWRRKNIELCGRMVTEKISPGRSTGDKSIFPFGLTFFSKLPTVWSFSLSYYIYGYDWRKIKTTIFKKPTTQPVSLSLKTLWELVAKLLLWCQQMRAIW